MTSAARGGATLPLPDFLADIEDDLRRGLLPAQIYNNREIYELEARRIFARCWVFIGHETEIPNPGDYATRNIGEDPTTLPRTYAKLINDTIAGKPADMAICLHLCRGNFAGSWVAEGGYEPIAELLFNEIKADGYFLEYDSPRAGGFEPLRFLPKGKVAVLGLVTTKSKTLEAKDELKRRIDAAAKFAPLERLALSPQCGFSSGIGGNTMTIDDEIAKLRLVVEVAREVWGSA